MDERLKKLAKSMAEEQLRVFLWEKVKKDWWEPEYEGQLYIDNEENILAVKIDNSIAIVGYVHIDSDFDETENFQAQILNHIVSFVAGIKIVALQYKWDKFKFIITTTYKLSNYNNMDFDKLPLEPTYFYMILSPQTVEKNYEMTIDKDLESHISGTNLLNYVLEQGKKPYNLE